jgi:hypothetical protein
MKYVIMAGGFAIALGLSPSILPVLAQDNVRQICINKHGLGQRAKHTASEERRKDSAARIAACIKSGGKS